MTVLVLVLGGLAIFLMGCNQVLGLDNTRLAFPNHYACECSCVGFGTGAVVSPAAATINVYDDPNNQNVVGIAAPANSGTIIGGPVQALLSGVDQTWWQVDFAAGADGWVVQSQLSIVTGAPLLTKDFQVCVVPAENQNIGGTEPTIQQLISDCSTDRVAPNLASLVTIPPGAQCGCSVPAGTTFGLGQIAQECNETCNEAVCLVAKADPSPPTPDPLSASLLGTTSICQVTNGTASITVGGHTPLTQPKVHGFVQIHGRPCPQGGCTVGLGFQFTADDIEFDSGSIFASNPKFVDLSMTGATTPDAISLGVLLGLVGEIPPGTATTTFNGRQSGSSDERTIVLENTQSVAFGVSWEGQACRLSGPLTGQIVGDNNQTADVQMNLEIDGVIVNQPPVPDASQTRTTVECTSPGGAPVTLSASASTDLDNNISYYIWRRDSDTGPLVGDPSASPVRHTTQGTGSRNYSVRVVDRGLASDTASVTVNVVDTTPPVINCNAPATITPPAGPVSFTATATDTCSATAPPVVIDNVQCQQLKQDGTLKASNSCKVTTQGGTITIANTGGVNNIIQWQAHATDGAGNATTQKCQVSVVNPGQ